MSSEPDGVADGAACLGIIMLDTAFERPPGDVGNRASWPMPVRFETVAGAGARAVVGGDDRHLLDGFVAAGRRLADRGALGLLTSCGFLAARQAELAARLPLPLATSSLMQLPLVERCLPAGRRAGVITYDAEALTGRHFASVGADPATPVAGLPPAGRFRGLIERGEPYDRAGLRAELLETARRLCGATPALGAIVLECTNLPPFSADVAAVTGLPVYDVVTLGRWFYSGLLRAAPETTDAL